MNAKRECTNGDNVRPRICSSIWRRRSSWIETATKLVLSIRGNTTISKFGSLGSAVKNGRKAASDEDTTINIMKKVKDVDFKVPSEMWVALQTISGQ